MLFVCFFIRVFYNIKKYFNNRIPFKTYCRYKNLINFNFINLPHHPIRLCQSLDDLLIMHDVFEIEDSAFAVFQPFLGGLVAADVEVPGDFRDGVEVLFGVDVDAAGG